MKMPVSPIPHSVSSDAGRMADTEVPNIGAACSDAICARGLEHKVALRFIPGSGPRASITFAQLAEESSRFANALTALGYAAGDRLFLCMPRQPAVAYVFLGALKAKVVAGMLFASFGEDALVHRLADAGARGVVTKRSQLRKLERIRERLPGLRHAILLDIPDHESDFVLSYPRLMRESSSRYTPGVTLRATPSVLHYTSVLTDRPLGVLHAHGSLPFQQQTSRDILDLRPDDVYWCTADHGWVTGTSYGMIGPWSLGVTQVQLGGNYDGAAWMCVLEEENVTVWYTAPTALRMLMREPPEVFHGLRLPRLRHIASVGEPLQPEVIAWARRTLGQDVHDTWFQTETGGIMIANRPGLAIRPGSMGQPVEGVEAAILDPTGQPLPDGEVGRLCLRRGWASMFLEYLHHPTVTAGKLNGDYYDTGDLAHRDRDGYFWFSRRSDEVINTAGHLVGPWEIESVLRERPEVADAVALAVPDDILFEKIVVFVVLKRGREGTSALAIELRVAISTRVSTFAAPRDVVFVDALPTSERGEVLRNVLRARYLGMPAGTPATPED